MSAARLYKPALRLSMLGFVVAGLAVVLATLGPVKQASADQCSINGRDCWFGYFFNGYDGGPGVRQHNLLTPPALLNINNAADMANTFSLLLRDCPGGRLWDQNDQNATGVAFIILTMLGAPPGTPKDEACRRFPEWRDQILFPYEQAGLINFNVVADFGGINTRSSRVDVTYYPDVGAAPSIVFYDPVTRLPVYTLKRDCGNPVGRLQRPPPLPYKLTPTVNVTPVGGTVEAGTTLNFSYTITNAPALRQSQGATCTIYIIDRNGYVAGSPLPQAGDPSQNFACPPLNPNASYTIPTAGAYASIVAQPNKTHCRRLVVTPSDQNGATAAAESCKVVVSKPYAQVFGGDVAAGSGFGTGCAQDNNSALVGWNKRVAGVGSGTQYAGFALNVLQDFASAQVNVGNATPPTGLSFSNRSTNAANGLFGTSFGAGSIACAPDYFSQKPAGATPLIGPIVPITPLASGTYAATGPITIPGGALVAGQRVVLYVDGDVYINDDITYGGLWGSSNVPLFKLVVRGNIFVAGSTGGLDGNGVGRLDGLYSAQPIAGAKGIIYTCTDPISAFTPLPLTSPGNTIFNLCNRKLVVNGSFTAQHVELLRSAGTLAQSAATDTSSSNNAAEVFNYSPAFWLAQPPDGSSTASSADAYDSIVSLPPLL